MAMSIPTDAAAEQSDIELLLPWYVTGRLDAADRARVEIFLAAHFDQTAYGALKFLCLGTFGIKLVSGNSGADDQLDAVVVEHVHQPGKTPRLRGLLA